MIYPYRMFNNLKSLFVVSIFLTTLAVGCSSGGGETSGDDGDGNGTNTVYKKNVSNSTADSSSPLISADSDGNVYIVWEEVVPSPDHTEVYLSESANSSIAFTAAKSLTDLRSSKCTNSIADVRSFNPDIALRSDGKPYLSWTYSWYSSGSGTGIKFFRNDDEFCNSVSDVTYDAGSPSLGISGSNNVHMVWTSQDDIFYRHSTDDGDTFLPSGSPLQISDTASDSSGPLLGFDGSMNVNVVWTEGAEGSRNISFSRSADGGESFTQYNGGSVSGTGIDSYCPVIATHGEGNIYIAFKGDDKIYFARWSEVSNSFPEVRVISAGSSSPSCPEMGIGENGMVYVVWADAGEIWVNRSAYGKYFPADPINISNSSGNSTSPKITMDESYINIVWVEEDTGDGDIFLSSSIDNGKSFSSPVNISESSGPSSAPVAVTDNEKYIYVAWVEGEEGSRDIYVVRDEAVRGISPVPVELSIGRILDVSGDGNSDIIIGAPEANSTGEVYLFFSDSIQGKTLTGEAGDDRFGYSVAIAGDINDDGYSDIIAGAPWAESGGDDGGKVYIFFGGTPSVMDTEADVTISGAGDNDYLGFSVSPAGDVNGDGYDDIIIGAPNRYQGGNPFAGEAYIFYGGPSLGAKDGYPDLQAEDADVILNGENAQDKFGSSVSWAGDFNKDGYDDVIVGAPFADGSGNTRGRSYIFYGGETMDSTADVKITGAANIDQLGSSVSRAGDMNDDGYGDVVIGAPWADVDVSGDNKGKAYVVFGGDNVDSSIDLSVSSSSVTVLSGFEAYERFGTSAGYGGDANNDGYDDVVIGGQYLGLDSSFAGSAYMYLGGASVDGTPDVTFAGEKQSDRFGISVAGAGDVDGDGYYDVLIGAYLADTGAGEDNGGKVYLYLGGAPEPDNSADAIFSGDVDDGWSGYSVYKAR